MKKLNLLLILAFALCQVSQAQNWSGIVTNRVSYYDFLRQNAVDQTGFISVDSSATIGLDTAFYFCKTYRDHPEWRCNPEGGASWMGRKFIRLANGNELYFNQLNDTIWINNQAQLNESWLLSTDTNGVTYQATVIGLDTMTINSLLDSTKSISLQAFNGSTPIGSDYNVTFVLSKHNGFVKLIPWFSFPYPVPLVGNSYFENFSFGGTINYLDSNSVFYKNYGESISKYQPGNEWITKCDTLLWDNYTDSTMGMVHDSIISAVTLPSGAIAFVSQRTEINKIGGVTTYFNQALVNDTINGLAANPLFDNSILKICPNYDLGVFVLVNPEISFETDTSNLCILTVDMLGSGFQYREVNFFSGQMCYSGAYLLEPTAVQKKWLAGFGMIKEDYNSMYYPIDLTCNVTYFKVNGQSFGSKTNFFLSANSFNLSLKTLSSGFQLNWQTVNEQNVHHFEVERSYDAIHFNKIGSQASLGNNVEHNQYEFMDDQYQSNSSNQVFYRIKMIDIDSKVFYSNVAKYDIANRNEAIVNTLFTNEITISHLDADVNYQLELKDATGKSLIREKVSGLTSFNLNNLSHLANGMYFLNIINLDLGNKMSFKLLKAN